jgi:hypothetical protein
MSSRKNKTPFPSQEPAATLSVSAWAGWGVAVWAVVVLFFYMRAKPLSLDYWLAIMDGLSSMSFWHPYAKHALVSVVFAAWLAWLASETGGTILRFFRFDGELSGWERWSWGSALGWGLFAYATFFAGAVGLWYPATFAVPLGIGTLAFGIRRWRLPREKIGASHTAALRAGPLQVLWWIFLIVGFGVALLGDLSPEVFYDSLHYHLAVPELYRLAHHLYAMPTLITSNFVMTIQMIYGLAITLYSDLTAKCVHLALGVVLAAGFLGFGERYLSKGAGLVAAAIFFSVPMVSMSLSTASVEVAWAFFQFAAAAALVRAMAEPGARWLVLAGTLTGIAAGCKYPGFAYIPIGALLLVIQRRAAGIAWGTAMKEASLFILPGALLVAPLLVRNAMFHGNPLYPFGGLQWGWPRIDPHYWQIFRSDTNVRDLAGLLHSPSEAMHFVLHPWYIAMEGAGIADFVGPLYLMTMPLLLLAPSPSSAVRWMKRYGVVLWAYWLLTTSLPRYGLPALALLTPVLADEWLILAQRPRLRPWLLGLLVIGLMSNTYYEFFTLYTEGSWRVLGGLVSKDVYLGSQQPFYPTPSYDGIVWMNHALPADAKVLMVGDCRSYYLKRTVIPNSVYDPQTIVGYSRLATPEAMAAAMRHDGVTHLFVNLAEAVRTDSYAAMRWTPESWRVLDSFWPRYTELLWRKEERGKALYVFRLLEEGEAAQPHAPAPNPFMRWKPQ